MRSFVRGWGVEMGGRSWIGEGRVVCFGRGGFV
jgi:hypothetical protein